MERIHSFCCTWLADWMRCDDCGGLCLILCVFIYVYAGGCRIGGEKWGVTRRCWFPVSFCFPRNFRPLRRALTQWYIIQQQSQLLIKIIYYSNGAKRTLFLYVYSMRTQSQIALQTHAHTHKCSLKEEQGEGHSLSVWVCVFCVCDEWRAFKAFLKYIYISH